MPGASTELLLCDLVTTIGRNNVESRYNLLTSLDVEGAYGGAQRPLLILLAMDLGIPWSILSFLDTWLRKRKSRRKFRTSKGVVYSHQLRVQVGSPRGGILSSIPWILLTCKLVTNINNSRRQVNISIVVAFFEFADDLNYTSPNSCLKTLHGESCEVATIVKKEYRNLRLGISEVKYFMRGETFLKTHRTDEGVTASMRRCPGDLANFNEKWPFPTSAMIRVQGIISIPPMTFEGPARELLWPCRSRERIICRISGLGWGMGAPLVALTYKSLAQS